MPLNTAYKANVAKVHEQYRITEQLHAVFIVLARHDRISNPSYWSLERSMLNTDIEKLLITFKDAKRPLIIATNLFVFALDFCVCFISFSITHSK